MDQKKPLFEKWKLLIIIFGSVIIAVLTGSGSSKWFHWDRLGTILAGPSVALLCALLSSKRPISSTLIGCVFTAVFCFVTIILRHWSTAHWPVGHIDAKWPVILSGLLLYICGLGLVFSVIIEVARRIYSNKFIPFKKVVKQG